MGKFKDWDKRESLAGKISGAFGRGQPLKVKLESSIYKLNLVKGRLNQLTEKLESKDRALLEKCMAAKASGDESRAKIYAAECAEVRRMARMIISSQATVEQTALRLETIKEFGDVAKSVGPLVNVVKSLQGKLKNVIPEASFELKEAEKSLSELFFETGEVSSAADNFQPSSPEAEKILEAASAIAEQRMKEKFPSLSWTEKVDEAP
jgi:division protein CdvB (Snf7/Vps24/ESCRT-III family)